MTPVRILEVPYVRDSSTVALLLAEREWPIWLDSGEGFPSHHIDILAADPLVKLCYDPAGTAPNLAATCRQPASLRECFSAMESQLNRYQHQQPLGPGWLGYLSYDLFNEIEPVTKRDKRELMPELVLGFYGWVIVSHHQLAKTYIHYLPEQEQAVTGIAEQLTPLNQPNEKNNRAQHVQISGFQLDSKFTANISRSDYKEQFSGAQTYIQQGDCYQINLTQQFSADCSGKGLAAYLALRNAHPSPMSAYFDCNEFDILSLSPERFIRRNGRRITSHPIKGTRPRHTDKNLDQDLKQALQNSSKDRAENVMIVDLLRNDLGRICRTGSVVTSQLFDVESFPNVHHLVSAIEGQLPDEIGLAQILQAVFPGGSITGAPKIRAMEIIEELEPHRRGVYCGSVVFFSGNGDIDSNIAIRTLVRKDSRIYCWGGGGIVADSNCDSEYQETLDKVGKLMQILETRFLTKPPGR